jgi:cell division protein FtsN
VPAVKDSGVYVLQLGSFRSTDQAEQFKQNLAKMGFMTQLQPITNSEKETWYRVRIGPYTNLDKLNDIRARLRKNNLNAMLVKLQN